MQSLAVIDIVEQLGARTTLTPLFDTFVRHTPARGACVVWYAAQLLCDTLNDLDNKAVVPCNKTDFPQ